MKEEFFGYSLLLIVRKKRDEGLFIGSSGACHSLIVSMQ
jgi:hypothetical protein